MAVQGAPGPNPENPMNPMAGEIWGHDWSAVFTRGFAPVTHYQVCERCKLERNPIDAVEIT